jgi:hypothetical protein
MVGEQSFLSHNGPLPDPSRRLRVPASRSLVNAQLGQSVLLKFTDGERIYRVVGRDGSTGRVLLQADAKEETARPSAKRPDNAQQSGRVEPVGFRAPRR